MGTDPSAAPGISVILVEGAPRRSVLHHRAFYLLANTGRAVRWIAFGKKSASPRRVNCQTPFTAPQRGRQLAWHRSPMTSFNFPVHPGKRTSVKCSPVEKFVV